MAHNTRELWLSFYAVISITVFYLFFVIRLGGVPAASDLFGHSLGIAGFTLMLMTETLYSLRKRSRRASWGRMSAWLRFHIFTGLVGPYLVLLHTSWKFNGLAGVVIWMTAIVVISGFIGRYIYTAIPRTADGIEMEAEEIQRQIQTAEAELRAWLADQPEALRRVSPALVSTSPELPTVPAAGRFTSGSGNRWQRWLASLQMDAAARAQVRQLERMLKRRRAFRRQVASLARARRLLAVWHALHIPLGLALFAAAFIHIIAAIYYATLLQ